MKTQKNQIELNDQKKIDELRLHRTVLKTRIADNKKQSQQFKYELERCFDIELYNGMVMSNRNITKYAKAIWDINEQIYYIKMVNNND